VVLHLYDRACNSTDQAAVLPKPKQSVRCWPSFAAISPRHRTKRRLVSLSYWRKSKICCFSRVLSAIELLPWVKCGRREDPPANGSNEILPSHGAAADADVIHVRRWISTTAFDNNIVSRKLLIILDIQPSCLLFGDYIAGRRRQLCHILTFSPRSTISLRIHVILPRLSPDLPRETYKCPSYFHWRSLQTGIY